MIKYNYISFLCEIDILQDEMSKLGQEGWRLHTCEPIVTMGLNGSNLPQVLVVMDMAVSEEEPEEETVSDFAPEGIALKG